MAIQQESSAAPDFPPDRGDALLVLFLAAVLLMVGAVALVTIVDAWWVLVPVMLVDLFATACVLGALAHLMRSS